MVRICIWTLRIPFEWFEVALQCCESLFEWFELAFECLKIFRMVRISIRMLQIPFEWLDFAHECLRWFSMVQFCFRMHRILSNASNSDSNYSNPSWVVRIWIWMLQILFEWSKFAIECLSNGSNLQSNASTPFRMVQICIRMPFEWFEFAFDASNSLLEFEFTDASNPFWVVWTYIWILRICFE